MRVFSTPKESDPQWSRPKRQKSCRGAERVSAAQPRCRSGPEPGRERGRLFQSSPKVFWEESL